MRHFGPPGIDPRPIEDKALGLFMALTPDEVERFHTKLKTLVKARSERAAKIEAEIAEIRGLLQCPST